MTLLTILKDKKQFVVINNENINNNDDNNNNQQAEPDINKKMKRQNVCVRVEIEEISSAWD